MLNAQGKVAWGDVHMELYVNARLTRNIPTKPNKRHKYMQYSNIFCRVGKITSAQKVKYTNLL